MFRVQRLSSAGPAAPRRSSLGWSNVAAALVLFLFCAKVAALTDENGVGRGGAEVISSGAADGELVQAARKWLAQLGDENFTVRKQAYEELKKLGRPALAPLTEALDAPDPEIRAKAAQVLVELRGRGFMGIQLQEDWNGIDDPPPSEDAGAAEEPAPRKEVGFKPPPRVVAVRVIRGGDQDMQNLVPQPLQGKDMPAERAGVKDGDAVLAVNGRSIGGLYDLLREVILAGPGTRTMLVVERDGKKISLGITLTRNPSDKDPPVDLLNEPEEKDGANASGEARRLPLRAESATNPLSR